MDIRKIDLSHSMILLLAAAFTLLMPSFIKTNVMRSFSKGLTIQTSKFEPPRVAFDEVFGNDSLNEWSLLKSKKGSQNLNETPLPFVAKTPVQKLHTQKLILEPMTFSQNEIQKAESDRAWMDELSAKEQTRLIAANEKHRTLDENWELPSFQQLAEQQIQKAKLTVESVESSREEKIKIEAVDENGVHRNANSVKTADVQTKKEGDADRAPDHYQVSGQIELSGGLPAGPQWVIQVSRYEDDVKKEDARIDLTKSVYKIQVPELSGSLYAQVVDQSTGQILGEGSYRLSPYSKDQINGQAKITIQRTNNSIAVNLGSYYRNPSRLTGKVGSVAKDKSVAAKVLFASAGAEGKTDENGVYRFDQIMKGSWGLLRTEAKDFFPSLFLVRSGTEKRLPLFPEKMVTALKQIIADQAVTSSVPESGSIVWGQVLQDGKPMAGATIAAEISELYQPIYFNSLLLPDSSLKATSENGFFAFIHLPAGFQALFATQGAAYLSHANVVVDEDAISIAEMESSLQTEKVEVKVFDALMGTAQQASLEFQSLPTQLDVKGFAEVNLPPISRLSLLRVHPQSEDYLESQQIYEDQIDFLHIPLVSKSWIASLQGARLVNVDPNAGMIVGFVSSGTFDVYLSHDDNYPRENVVYFNSQGQVVESGVPGGGFVLMNVPQGVQSVVVASKESDLIQSQVVPVDTQSASVLKFR
jgi:uncharacterized GH25 family protein